MTTTAMMLGLVNKWEDFLRDGGKFPPQKVTYSPLRGE